MESLQLYVGGFVEFEFAVDDPTTLDIDDLSAVEWAFRILGADDEVVEVAGTYDYPTVMVEIPAATSETIAPGIYQWYLVALQNDVDEIVVDDGILLARPYPAAPSVIS